MADGSDSDTGHNPSGSMIIKGEHAAELSRERKFTEIDLIPFRPEFQSLLMRGRGDDDYNDNERDNEDRDDNEDNEENDDNNEDDDNDDDNDDNDNDDNDDNENENSKNGKRNNNNNNNNNRKKRKSVDNSHSRGKRKEEKEKRETWCQYDESDLAIEPDTEWPIVYKSSNNDLWRSCFGTIIIDHRTMYNNNDEHIDNPRFGINFDSKYPSRSHSQQASQTEFGLSINGGNKSHANRLSIADASKLISNINSTSLTSYNSNSNLEYQEPKMIPSFMMDFGKCIEWEIEITDMKDGDGNGQIDCVLIGICEYNDQINSERSDFLRNLQKIRLTQRQSMKHPANHSSDHHSGSDSDNSNSNNNNGPNDKFLDQIDGLCYAVANTGKTYKKTFAEWNDNASQESEAQYDTKLEISEMKANEKLTFYNQCNVRLRLDYSDMSRWKLQAITYQNKQWNIDDYVTLFDDIPPGSYRLAASLLAYESTIKLHNCDVLGAYKPLHNAYGSFFTDFENTNFGMHIVSNLDPENIDIANASDNENGSQMMEYSNDGNDGNDENDENDENEIDDIGIDVQYNNNDKKEEKEKEEKGRNENEKNSRNEKRSEKEERNDDNGNDNNENENENNEDNEDNEENEENGQRNDNDNGNDVTRRSVTFDNEENENGTDNDKNNSDKDPPRYGSRNRTMSMNRYAMNALREEYARLESTVQGYKDTIESNREEIEDLKERLAEAEKSKCQLVISVSEELNNYRQIIRQLADRRIVVKLPQNGYVVNRKKY